MEISWLGHSSFKLRGKKVTIITDPFSPVMVGFKFPKIEADIVTVSHQHDDHNQTSLVDGEPFVIDGPGEYEVKGVYILGVSLSHDASGGSQRGKITACVIQMDDLKVCHLGDLGSKLTAEQVEELNEIDILMIPVGGVVTISPEEAVEVIAQLEPRIVIPMHYQEPGLNPETFAKLSGVEEFLKKIGEKIIPIPKLTVTKESLPEERQVVVLERKNG